MASIQDNLARVRSSLAAHDTATNTTTSTTHADIIDAYSDAIREHQEQIQARRRAIDEHARASRKRRRRGKRDEGPEEEEERSPERPGLRFRFKEKKREEGGGGGGGGGSEETDDGSKRRRRRRRRDGERSSRHRHPPRYAARPRHASSSEAAGRKVVAWAAHPLPRPDDDEDGWLDPAMTGRDGRVRGRDGSGTLSDEGGVGGGGGGKGDPDEAFKASLFDALADDEGAAAYWEGVYSQPLHVYPRPWVRVVEHGEVGEGGDTALLEEMGDEEYAAYVKRKMWERANPELVREMKVRDEKRLEEEEVRRARRRRRPGEQKGPRKGQIDDVEEALRRGNVRKGHKERAKWEAEWEAYVKAWKMVDEGGKVIAWPVFGRRGDAVDVDRVREFLREVMRWVLPETEDRSSLRTAMLKAERFRWHPDKILQRFGGKEFLAEDVLENVTAVFQVIDGMLDELKNSR